MDTPVFRNRQNQFHSVWPDKSAIVYCLLSYRISCFNVHSRMMNKQLNHFHASVLLMSFPSLLYQRLTGGLFAQNLQIVFFILICFLPIRFLYFEARKESVKREKSLLRLHSATLKAYVCGNKLWIFNCNMTCLHRSLIESEANRHRIVCFATWESYTVTTNII
jgi:hypothetical protein